MVSVQFSCDRRTVCNRKSKPTRFLKSILLAQHARPQAGKKCSKQHPDDGRKGVIIGHTAKRVPLAAVERLIEF